MAWASDVDALREASGAPNDVHLIPPHVLKATLPKIGGKIATITKGGEQIGRHGAAETAGIEQLVSFLHSPLTWTAPEGETGSSQAASGCR